MGDAVGAPARAGDVVALRRGRRRRHASPASTGWSTRCSTSAPGASTATRPTSTSARPALERVETGLGEPGDDGVAAALADFRRRLARPAPTTRTATPRAARCSSGPSTLADAIRVQAAQRRAPRPVTSASACSTDVAEVNTVAGDLAATNRSIAAGQPERHRRRHPARQARPARAAPRPSSPAPRPRSAPTAASDVTVNGVPLVTGGDAGSLEVAVGVDPDGTATAPGVVRDHRPPAPPTAPARPDRRAALTELLDTTLPGVPRGPRTPSPSTLADDINAQHGAGYDAAGTAGARDVRATTPRTRPARSRSRSPTRPGGRLERPGGGIRRRERRPPRQRHPVADDLPAAGQRLRHRGRLRRPPRREPAGRSPARSTAPASSSRASTSTRRWCHMIAGAARLRGRRPGDDHAWTRCSTP